MSASPWLLGGLLVFGMADVVAIDLVVGPRALSSPRVVPAHVASAPSPMQTVPESSQGPGAIAAAIHTDGPSGTSGAGPASSGSPDRPGAPLAAAPSGEASGEPSAETSADPPGAPPIAPVASAVERPAIVIYFATDHDTLDETATRTLGALASELANTAEIVDVVGHADVRGTEHHNEDLSARRMRRVRDYLAAHGVDSERLHGRAAGDREPAREGADEASLAANRRVEIRRTP